jgi:hypothetical protein
MGRSVMRAHVIKKGVVANTIEVKNLKILPGLVDASKGGHIGDTYKNGLFASPTKPPKPKKKINLKELTTAEHVKLINFLKTNDIVTAARAKKLKGDN